MHRTIHINFLQINIKKILKIKFWNKLSRMFQFFITQKKTKFIMMRKGNQFIIRNNRRILGSLFPFISILLIFYLFCFLYVIGNIRIFNAIHRTIHINFFQIKMKNSIKGKFWNNLSYTFYFFITQEQTKLIMMCEGNQVITIFGYDTIIKQFALGTEMIMFIAKFTSTAKKI